MSQTGLDWILYRNTGSHETPVWSEACRAQNVTLPITKQMANVPRRCSRWQRSIGSLKDGPLEADYVYRNGSDAHLLAFLDSFGNNTPIELAVTDQPIAEEGAFGFRAYYECSDFPLDQPLTEGVILKLKFALADKEDDDGNPYEPDFIGWSGDDSSSPGA